MKVQANREIEVYEVSGQELRVHWSIQQKTKENLQGEEETYWEAVEALCSKSDGRTELIEKIISTEYSTGRELATINNKETDPKEYTAYQAFRLEAKQLADGWITRNKS
jgi:thioesterase domain-containing protein